MLKNDDIDTEVFFQENAIEIESFTDTCIFLTNGYMLEKLDRMNGEYNYSLYLGIDQVTRVYWPSTKLGHDHIDGPVCLLNRLDRFSYKGETVLNEILKFLRFLQADLLVS